MLHTYETRLTVDADLDALLAAQAAHWSGGLRKAWTLLYRQRLTKPQAYAVLMKHNFTSAQVGSLLISAEMKHAGLVELKKYELKQLELAIVKREHAVFDKNKKVLALKKRQAKLRSQRDKFAPKAGKERTKRFLKTLRVLRDVDQELAFCRNWIKQKERVLRDKRGKLKRLQDDIAAGRYSLCFGSKNLLAQRPTGANAATTPFTSVEAWQIAWANARDGQWWSVGHTDEESGNKEVRWFPGTNQLRIRLTDQLAHERMDARDIPRAGTEKKFMPLRMQCRFITLDNVDFTSHKGAARAALAEAFGKRPVTMRVLSRLQPDGSRAWYVQASLDVPSGFAETRPVTRESGMLGLDFNARGVAWCAVKPDGNRLRDQHGFMPWHLKGLTEAERKQVLDTTVAQLARHAKRLSMAVAIESLDFSTKRLMARAGAVNKRYNDMLGSLPSTQFEQMMLRACEKLHLTLYSVNPLYSSVGGFTKYGRPNRMNADTSAALWIGRQALLADVRKDEGPQVYMKHFDERLVFSHLPATPMRSMTALAGAQWRDVAWGLGSNRRLWGVKLRRWFELQVGTASRPKGQPVPALAPAG
ncbi:hypothetical protein [Pelomonas cellulosilytica]|uniref:Transposase n=1 Tax=Pelomonas cellulosilytica TaxID=2906762 RepID=A0ABS8Y3G6_9BURK|nr:hypothetical protein [Pelomonas sp. P8]MCE4557684.1 hypothetical protein [Pelomonas sp. P8]